MKIKTVHNWPESVEIPQRWTFALHSTDQCVQETVDVTICARRTRSFVGVSGYAVNPFTGELTCWGDVDACVEHHRRTLDESDRTA